MRAKEEDLKDGRRIRRSERGAAPLLEYGRRAALGGLPIKVADDVVGAVGVSGSPGKDDVCSQAGVDKVADQLN